MKIDDKFFTFDTHHRFVSFAFENFCNESFLRLCFVCESHVQLIFLRWLIVDELLDVTSSIRWVVDVNMDWDLCNDVIYDLKKEQFMNFLCFLLTSMKHNCWIRVNVVYVQLLTMIVFLIYDFYVDFRLAHDFCLEKDEHENLVCLCLIG